MYPIPSLFFSLLFLFFSSSSVLAKQPKVELPPPASPEPPQKTVAVQTVYRESEAQTDPYTPDFVIPEGENPQILDLAQLNFGIFISLLFFFFFKFHLSHHLVLNNYSHNHT